MSSSRMVKEEQQQNLFPACNVELKVDLNVLFALISENGSLWMESGETISVAYFFL